MAEIVDTEGRLWRLTEAPTQVRRALQGCHRGCGWLWEPEEPCGFDQKWVRGDFPCPHRNHWEKLIRVGDRTVGWRSGRPTEIINTSVELAGGIVRPSDPVVTGLEPLQEAAQVFGVDGGEIPWCSDHPAANLVVIAELNAKWVDIRRQMAEVERRMRLYRRSSRWRELRYTQIRCEEDIRKAGGERDNLEELFRYVSEDTYRAQAWQYPAERTQIVINWLLDGTGTEGAPAEQVDAEAAEELDRILGAL